VRGRRGRLFLFGKSHHDVSWGSGVDGDGYRATVGSMTRASGERTCCANKRAESSARPLGVGHTSIMALPERLRVNNPQLMELLLHLRLVVVHDGAHTHVYRTLNFGLPPRTSAPASIIF
jgi:hypothetical protein